MKKRPSFFETLQPYKVPMLAVMLVCGSVYLAGFATIGAVEYRLDSIISPPKRPAIDIADYNARKLALAGIRPTVLDPLSTTTPETPYTTAVATDTMSIATPLSAWPVAGPYPRAGAILPFNRIIAYYGNFYSTKMGALGEYPADEMLTRLQAEVDAWTAADPTTPAIPAIHYIAMTAQGSPGEDGMYRLRMPDDQIEHAIALAERAKGIVFIDLQVGLSTLQKELPKFEKFLVLPQVHLGIDPEFAMQNGTPPGKAIGTLDATDVNWVIQYLSELVQRHDLPPKVLVVHRFTEKMLTNADKIRPTSEVQVVIHMDGWGPQQNKRNTYYHAVIADPVQFAGVKIFYKHDTKPPSTGIFMPHQLLEFTPVPVYIQYQ